ncbi:MAG: hypothetical protein ABR602_10745 [Gemmatimonadales bacterium]
MTYVPAGGLAGWRAGLSKPDLHWKRGASAFEAAVSWELAGRGDRGLPPEVASMLDQVEELRGSKLLFAFPEHKVSLPGGSRASQNDVWAVLKSSTGLVSLAVEAKAEESFDRTVAEWQKDASDGRKERLNYLTELLRPATPFPETIRYQLLHRTASAIIEARRIGATCAVMLVQSFREPSRSATDFTEFVRHLGAELIGDGLVKLPGHDSPALFVGWVTSALCSDRDIVRVSE